MSSWLLFCCGLILLCRPVTEVHSCATISNAYKRTKKPAQGVLVFSAGRDLRMNMGRTFCDQLCTQLRKYPKRSAGGEQQSCGWGGGAPGKIRRKKAAKGAVVVALMLMRGLVGGTRRRYVGRLVERIRFHRGEMKELM